MNVVLNGGLKSIEASQQQLSLVDGVMLGREAYYNPYILSCVDKDIYKDNNAPVKTREEIVYQMCDYIDNEIARGTELHSMTRHILGLYHGCRGAKAWRRHLSEEAHIPKADSSVLKAALLHVMD